MIHPDDAKNLAFKPDELVEVSSGVGSVQIPIEITDEIMPGTVSIPHGWGHHRDGIKMETAAKHPGVSLNDLIDDQRVDSLCGVAVINGTQVKIRSLTQKSSV